MLSRIIVLAAFSAFLFGCQGCDQQPSPTASSASPSNTPKVSPEAVASAEKHSTRRKSDDTPESLAEPTAVPPQPTETPRVTPEPTPVEKLALREVAPNQVKRGEFSSIAITGKKLHDARVYLRSEATGVETEVTPDGITAGEEIVINDRNWNEFEPGVYTIVIRTPDGGETTLPNSFTINP